MYTYSATGLGFSFGVHSTCTASEACRKHQGGGCGSKGKKKPHTYLERCAFWGLGPGSVQCRWDNSRWDLEAGERLVEATWGADSRSVLLAFEGGRIGMLYLTQASPSHTAQLLPLPLPELERECPHLNTTSLLKLDCTEEGL